MSRDRRRLKGRREFGTFFALPHEVMASANWQALSGSGAKLLCDLGRQYCGYNNGDLCAAWTTMRAFGWKSRDTLQRAIAQLLKRGLIQKTRQGGLHRSCLYALTWLPIDECGGKLEVPASRVASGLWKTVRAVADKKMRCNAGTESVSVKPESRAYASKAA